MYILSIHTTSSSLSGSSSEEDTFRESTPTLSISFLFSLFHLEILSSRRRAPRVFPPIAEFRFFFVDVDLFVSFGRATVVRALPQTTPETSPWSGRGDASVAMDPGRGGRRRISSAGRPRAVAVDEGAVVSLWTRRRGGAGGGAGGASPRARPRDGLGGRRLRERGRAGGRVGCRRARPAAVEDTRDGRRIIASAGKFAWTAVGAGEAGGRRRGRGHGTAKVDVASVDDAARTAVGGSSPARPRRGGGAGAPPPQTRSRDGRGGHRARRRISADGFGGCRRGRGREGEGERKRKPPREGMTRRCELRGRLRGMSLMTRSRGGGARMSLVQFVIFTMCVYFCCVFLIFLSLSPQTSDN